MLEQKVPVSPDWVQQLSGLVLLAGCAAMAAPGPKARASILPAAATDAVAKPKPRKKNDLSPEAREFMRLPPHIQRQVLGYARNWIEASFEGTS
jgi:hypothetical protein